jgi:hypothetical protein
MSTSTRASSSPKGDDDPKSAPVALGLGAMVAVGSPIAKPGAVVNILGSMADDGVRCASEGVGVTLVVSSTRPLTNRDVDLFCEGIQEGK